MITMLWVIVLSIFIERINTQSISIPITYNYLPNYISAEILIGTPPQPLHFILSTKLVSEMIQNEKYNQTISSSLKISTQMTTQETYHQGNYSSDILTFESGNLPDFQFILIDENELDFVNRRNQGMISLCRATTSLLSSLFYAKLIKKRVLQFHQKTLIFGIIDNKINNTHSSRCDLVPFDNLWACYFDGITFNNNPKGIHPIDSRVVFNLNKRNIIFPQIYRELFVQKYFSFYLEKDLCKEYEGMKGWTIECLVEIIKQLGSITFHFRNNIKIKTNYNDLFEEDMLDLDNQIFNIFFSKSAHFIEFGSNILKKFSIAFNDDENYAEFYIPIENNENDSLQTEEDDQLVKEHIVFVLCIVILFCGSIMLFISLCKKIHIKHQIDK